MATKTRRPRVVTWQSPSGATYDLCRACEQALTAAGTWPRDGSGQEYCRVEHGLHVGTCDRCGATSEDVAGK